MLEVDGLWLPEGEAHLQKFLEKSKTAWPGEQPSYQRVTWMVVERVLEGRPKRHALDVGAHVGLWTKRMAASFGSVTAFEPVHSFRECWRKNLEGVANVRMLPAGLAAATQVVGMEVVPGNSGATHVGATAGGELAVAVALDELGMEDVDFVKIDVEGYEKHVLYGAQETLQRWRPVVCLEQKNHQRWGGQFEALEMLKKWGMRERAKVVDDWILDWLT